MAYKRRIFVLAALMVVAATATFAATKLWPGQATVPEPTAPEPASITGQTGLPLPRFVSLKTAEVNVRRGPSRSHPIAWQYRRRGLPVEIVKEFENWRLIRDVDGDEGWVYHGLLAAQRHAVVAPWDKADLPRSVRERPESDRPARAQAEPGAVVTVRRCTGTWCEVDAQGHRGWIEQAELWGVYPNERFD